jgi:hypothetical protein
VPLLHVLSETQALTGSIAASNGTLAAVTSEPASELAATRSASGYTGKVIADPDNVLAQELKRRGLVDVAVGVAGGVGAGQGRDGAREMGDCSVYGRGFDA